MFRYRIGVRLLAALVASLVALSLPERGSAEGASADAVDTPHASSKRRG